MKLSPILLLLVAVVIASCSKSPTAVSNAPVIGATVNGQAWNASPQGVNDYGTLRFVATSDSMELAMAFPPSIKDTGTYQIDTLVTASFTIKGTVYDGNGTTHLTYYSLTHLIGTFTFIGQDLYGDQVTINNGNYNVTF